MIDAGGRIGRDFAPERQQEQLSLFGALAAHVAARRKQGDVVIASYSDGARERLAGLLADSGVTDAREIARAAEIDGGSGLCLAVWPLEHGFEAPGLTVISEQDVLGDRLIRAAAAAEARGELPDRGGGADAGRSGRARRPRHRPLPGARDHHRDGRRRTSA